MFALFQALGRMEESKKLSREEKKELILELFAKQNLGAIQKGGITPQELRAIASFLTAPTRKETEEIVRELEKTSPGILRTFQAIAAEPGVRQDVEALNVNIEAAAEQAQAGSWQYAAEIAIGAAVALAGFMLLRKAKQKGLLKPIGRAWGRVKIRGKSAVVRAEEALGKTRITPTQLPEQPVIRKGITDAFAKDVGEVGKQQARKRLEEMGKEMAGRGYQVMDTTGRLRKVEGLKVAGKQGEEKIMVVLEEGSGVQVEGAATTGARSKKNVALDEAEFYEPLTVGQSVAGRAGARASDAAERGRNAVEEARATIGDEAVASERVGDILGRRTRSRWRGPLAAAGVGGVAAAGWKIAREHYKTERKDEVVATEETQAGRVGAEIERLEGMKPKALVDDWLAKAKKGIEAGNATANWMLVRDCAQWLLANVDFETLDAKALEKFEETRIARRDPKYMLALVNFVAVNKAFLLADEERLKAKEYAGMEREEAVGRIHEAEGSIVERISKALNPE